MVVVKKDQIVGFLVDQELVCRNCIKHSEKDQLMQHSLILQDEAENQDWCFCDRCGKKIS